MSTKTLTKDDPVLRGMVARRNWTDEAARVFWDGIGSIDGRALRVLELLDSCEGTVEDADMRWALDRIRREIATEITGA